MISPKKIDQLARQVADTLPPGVRQIGDEVEKQVKQIVQSGLSKLDMVPREEFDIQSQVLLRTRQKLEALERKVAELEQRLAPEADTQDEQQDSEKAE